MSMNFWSSVKILCVLVFCTLAMPVLFHSCQTRSHNSKSQDSLVVAKSGQRIQFNVPWYKPDDHERFQHELLSQLSTLSLEQTLLCPETIDENKFAILDFKKHGLISKTYDSYVAYMDGESETLPTAIDLQKLQKLFDWVEPLREKIGPYFIVQAENGCETAQIDTSHNRLVNGTITTDEELSALLSEGKVKQSRLIGAAFRSIGIKTLGRHGSKLNINTINLSENPAFFLVPAKWFGVDAFMKGQTIRISLSEENSVIGELGQEVGSGGFNRVFDFQAPGLARNDQDLVLRLRKKQDLTNPKKREHYKKFMSRIVNQCTETTKSTFYCQNRSSPISYGEVENLSLKMTAYAEVYPKMKGGSSNQGTGKSAVLSIEPVSSKAQLRPEGKMAALKLTLFSLQVLKSMRVDHGLNHFDFKFENVLEGEDFEYTIADLNSSAQCDIANLKATARTIAYSPKFSLEGDELCSYDLYSLGISILTLFHTEFAEYVTNLTTPKKPANAWFEDFWAQSKNTNSVLQQEPRTFAEVMEDSELGQFYKLSLKLLSEDHQERLRAAESLEEHVREKLRGN